MVSAAGFEVERAPRREAAEAERPERKPVRRAGFFGTAMLLLGAAALVGLAREGSVRRRISRRRSAGQIVGRAAGDLGRGALAGIAGTAAITAASTVDQLVTEAIHARKEKRKADLDVIDAIVSPWSFSAGVVSKVLGITPNDPQHERRLSVMAHWEYGSSWGLSLAAMRALGVRGVPAMAMLLAGQLTAEMVVMPAFKLSSSPTQWGRRALVSSVYQHAIYAIAAVSVFEWSCPDET